LSGLQSPLGFGWVKFPSFSPQRLPFSTGQPASPPLVPFCWKVQSRMADFPPPTTPPPPPMAYYFDPGGFCGPPQPPPHNPDDFTNGDRFHRSRGRASATTLFCCFGVWGWVGVAPPGRPLSPAHCPQFSAWLPFPQDREF